jgi:hypothetical protein
VIKIALGELEMMRIVVTTMFIVIMMLHKEEAVIMRVVNILLFNRAVIKTVQQ